MLKFAFQRIISKIGVSVVLTLSAMLLLFQNCSSGFTAIKLSTLAGTSFCVGNTKDDACLGNVLGTEATCKFDGKDVAENAKVTAYLNSTSSNGVSCKSEVRTCTKGVLSGSYAYANCTAVSLKSCLFNGVTVPSGSSIQAYASSVGSNHDSCLSQTRVCTDGVLSGTAQYSTCTIMEYKKCLFDNRTIDHGDRVAAFPVSSVPFGKTCESTTRICMNGALTGSGEYGSCVVAQPASCLFDGQTIPSGMSVSAFPKSSVPVGGTCTATTRTCTNGVLSGAGDFASCAVDALRSCLFDGKTIPSGQSVTNYFAQVVPIGQTCTTEVRVCNDGALSGTAPFSSCTVTPPPRLSDIAKTANVDVIIPEGTTLELDQVPPLRILQIEGKLVCPPSGNVTLAAQGIMVYGNGVFECGTQATRFQGRLNVELNAGALVMGSERSFVVFNGGQLKLNGAAKNLTWLRLAQTAEAGAQTLVLGAPVDWSAGDHIALAPTSFDPHEAEEKIIASVSADGRTVQLTSPLAFRHWGQTQTFASQRRNWIVEESAEVANLNRNIHLYAPGEPAALDYRGGHMMVMSPGKAFIDAVEFSKMGRMGEMARYPFHWHRAGDVSGQFVVNSSFHQTFQRCVTVHGTNNALVQNNVCFDHFGHGFFLEDGNETGNHLINNLGILTKLPLPNRHILQSDIDRSQLPRWAGPSTFWISNPSNDVTGNVAAGSEGSGFWSAFAEGLSCDTNQCHVVTDGSGNVFPSKSAFGKFDQNTARASLVGATWDGADIGPLTGNPRNPNDRQMAAVHFTSPTMPIVNDLTLTKNSFVALYFRGQPFTFDRAIIADNRAGIWLAYNQRVVNSLFLGQSANNADREYDYLASIGSDPGYISGVWLYDGPLELTNVDFLNYSAAPVMHGSQNVASVPFRTVGGANRFTNRTQGLFFAPEPWRRFILRPDNWGDSPYTLTVHDLDGTLIGAADQYLVGEEAYNQDGGCSVFAGTRAMRCSYRPGALYTGILQDPFQLIRNDGPATRDIADIGQTNTLWNKAGLILNNGGFEYTVRMASDKQARNASFFRFQAESAGQLSPVLRFAGVGSGCNATNVPNVGSLDEVRGRNGPAGWNSGIDYYLKVAATGQDPLADGKIAIGDFIVSCAAPAGVDPRLSPVVFNAGYYASRYADLAMLNEGALRQHWVENGIAESRQAHPTFIVSEYLEMHKDLRDAFGDSRSAALLHYVNNGQREGRPGRVVVNALVFNVDHYRAANPDLAMMRDDEARNHWLNHGIAEGRVAHPSFSVRTYLAKYGDLSAAFGGNGFEAAIRHYVTVGASEGRTGN